MHPKEVAAKKRRICRVLDQDGRMTIRELLKAVQPSCKYVEKRHESENWMSKSELETLLDELDEEEQVVRDGEKWRTT